MEESDAMKEMGSIGVKLELGAHTLDTATVVIQTALGFHDIEDTPALGAACILIACEERELMMDPLTVAQVSDVDVDTIKEVRDQLEGDLNIEYHL